MLLVSVIKRSSLLSLAGGGAWLLSRLGTVAFVPKLDVDVLT